MSDVGRPSKLTREVEEKLLQALRAGNFRNVAALWAGVSARTLREWMAKGKDAPSSKEGTFRRHVMEAEKAAEMAMVAVVLRAAREDAKHAEWWLERKAHARWGRRQKHEVKGDQDSPIVVEVLKLGG